MTSNRSIVPYVKRGALTPVGMYALGQLLQQTPNIINAGAKAIGRGATNYLNTTFQGGDTPPQGVTQVPASGLTNFVVSRRSRGRGRRRKGRKTQQVSRDSIRLHNRAYFQLSNTATGVCNNTVWVGYRNTNATTDLYTLSTQLNSMGAAFATFTVHSISVQFIPFVADTTKGQVGFTFNSYHQGLSTSTTYASIIERGGILGDVKAPFRMNWVPDTEQERESKCLADASSVAVSAVGSGSLRNFAPGYFQLHGTNDLATGEIFGALIFEFDITFSDPF